MSRSFLPLVQLCDNFRLSSTHPVSSSGLVSFCLNSDPRSAVGLLWPEIVIALSEDNEHLTKAGRKPSWVLVNIDIRSSSRLVHFASHLSTPALRSEALNDTCVRWRDTGVFADVIGGRMWRSELYPVYRNPFGPHTPEDVMFEVERAASSLFGVITYGVHMTIYHPPSPDTNNEMMLWIPTRSRTKQTWPGYLDNTVAGGIPSGISPYESLVKESMEEASITEEIIRKHVRAVGAISYFFQKNERWLQPEVEYVYELAVPRDTPPALAHAFRPRPLDGEVELFELLPLSEVIPRLHRKLFKPNCALVLVDFLVRHGYITAENENNFLEIQTRLHGRFEYDRW